MFSRKYLSIHFLGGFSLTTKYAFRLIWKPSLRRYPGTTPVPKLILLLLRLALLHLLLLTLPISTISWTLHSHTHTLSLLRVEGYCCSEPLLLVESTNIPQMYWEWKTDRKSLSTIYLCKNLMRKKLLYKVTIWEFYEKLLKAIEPEKHFYIENFVHISEIRGFLVADVLEP